MQKGLCGTELLQAWTAYGASLLRSRMSPDEFAEFVETARHAEDVALSRLTDVAVELVQGEPRMRSRTSLGARDRRGRDGHDGEERHWRAS